jgi:hypothetical protein
MTKTKRGEKPGNPIRETDKPERTAEPVGNRRRSLHPWSTFSEMRDPRHQIRSKTYIDEESGLTQAQFYEDTLISKILARARATGEVLVNPRTPMYGEQTTETYHERMTDTTTIRNNFADLPAEQQKQLGGSAEAALEAVQDGSDPAILAVLTRGTSFELDVTGPIDTNSGNPTGENDDVPETTQDSTENEPQGMETRSESHSQDE